MIEFQLRTTRRFKDLSEAHDFLWQMVLEHPFGSKFWNKIIKSGSAEIVSDEPINNTDITTRGFLRNTKE